MEIKINKEIKEYNETVFFGLSVRQFVFSILACGAAVAIYFGGRSFLDSETLYRCECDEQDHDQQSQNTENANARKAENFSMTLYRVISA